jgi:hypothetical protein
MDRRARPGRQLSAATRKNNMSDILRRRDITFQEYGALLATRELLASNFVQHDCDASLRSDEHNFNMKTACATMCHGSYHAQTDQAKPQSHCGTVSCIGGTMALIMGMDDRCAQRYVNNNHSPSLHELFFPPEDLDYNLLNNRQAVRAIDNWRRIGRPCWHRVVATVK